MRFSENRTLAWCIFALCVAFSLSVSGVGALRNQRIELQNDFVLGVSRDGLSINNDLTRRSEAAYNLASTALNYPAIDATLAQTAKDESNALAAATEVEDKYAINAACQQAVEDLYTAIENADISETDRAFLNKQYKEFKSRGDTIARDPYNQKAQQFNQSLTAFPANVLCQIFGLQPLSLFS